MNDAIATFPSAAPDDNEGYPYKGEKVFARK